MYYIYHIKGVKWGMTDNLKRRLKQQGYKSAYEVINETDLDKAADLEMELNIRDGYPWSNTQDYRVIKKIASAGGKRGGNAHIKSGHLKKLNESNKKKVIAYDVTTNKFIGEYDSIKSAAIALKCNAPSITVVCKGGYKHHRGYRFEYKTN